MIKVQWNDFAKRRNLQLKKFIESMPYKEYKRWCEYRSVVPVPETHYSIEKQTETLAETTSETESVPHYTRKELTKMLKADVSALASELNIELDGTETKKKIVSLILSLNKS